MKFKILMVLSLVFLTFKSHAAPLSQILSETGFAVVCSSSYKTDDTDRVLKIQDSLNHKLYVLFLEDRLNGKKLSPGQVRISAPALVKTENNLIEGCVTMTVGQVI